MTRRIICLLITAASVIGAVPLIAQEGAPAAAGTLTLDKKTYTLKRALAYETTIDDEDAIAVVLSGQPVTSEMLKVARDAEKGGGDPDFKRPFLRLVFKKTGELKNWSAAAGGTMHLRKPRRSMPSALSLVRMNSFIVVLFILMTSTARPARLFPFRAISEVGE